MSFHYIAIITTDAVQPARRITESKLSTQAEWTDVLSTDFAKVWVRRSHPTSFEGRPIASGCILGAAFPRNRLQQSGDSFEGDDWWGAYVAIFVDNKGDVTVTRDPTGRIDCWRLSAQGHDIIFSHSEDLVALGLYSPSLNWAYLRYHLQSPWLRGSETGLEGITELLPGFALTYGNGVPAQKMWWRPERIANERHSDPTEAKEAIRLGAENAIVKWAARYPSIALELSGGLDSTIVLGLLSRVAHHPDITCINYVTSHVEGDERIYARDAAAHNHAKLIEFAATPTGDGTFMPFSGKLTRPSARILTSPFEQQQCGILSELGTSALFAGTAGDHLFLSSPFIDSISDYRRDFGIGPGMVRVAHQLALVSRRTIWDGLMATVDDAVRGSPTDPSLFVEYNPHLSDAMGGGLNAERFAHPWLFDGSEKVGPGKRKQILSFFEVQRHYMRYGRADLSEEVHPLFSQPIIDACLRTPTYWFSEGGIQRGLAREAFRDLLPETIRHRRSKGTSGSYWTQVLLHDLPRIQSALLEGHLSRSGYLNKSKVEAALAALDLTRPKDFGPLLQTLSVELWIQQVELDRVTTDRSAA
jgi:asparagine synthase (glutamine-hydrolysing)